MKSAQEIGANRLLAGHVILLIDDSAGEVSYLEDLLCQAGARVLLAETNYQAIVAGRRHHLTWAVLDINIGDDTIHDVCTQLDRDGVPWVLLPSPGDPSRAEAVIGALIKLLCVAPNVLNSKRAF